MALRDFYALNETLAQPSLPSSLEKFDLAPQAVLPEQPTNPAEPLPDLDPPELTANTNAVQVLAQEMEQLRKQLVALLLLNPEALALLTENFNQNFVEGLDYSNNTHDKGNSGKVVQKTDLVQLADEQTERDKLNSVHIFPAVLIRIAKQVQQSAAISSEYKQQLVSVHRKLAAIREKMIVTNTGLVAYLAYRYKTTNLSFEDLMQEGTVGLIRAVDRFDPERGICFSTYAVFWIKQAISRLIVKQEKVVRLPVALAEKASAVFEVMRNTYLEFQRWPTLAELNAQCNLTPDEIKTVSSYYQATHSLDANLADEGDDHTLMDSMQQQQFPLPLEELINNNLALYLGNLIASLPEKEASILNMRFGLKNQSEMTLQAIADHLEVTRERVRQIQNQALKKLKQQFGCELVLFMEIGDY